MSLYVIAWAVLVVDVGVDVIVWAVLTPSKMQEEFRRHCRKWSGSGCPNMVQRILSLSEEGTFQLTSVDGVTFCMRSLQEKVLRTYNTRGRHAELGL